MQKQPAIKTEDLRLKALYRQELLDTVSEPAFDALVRAAAQVCDVPVSLISLVDADRQWFKAGQGLPQGSETPREHAFCAHAIQEPTRVFEVGNARVDDRFKSNPLVTGEPRIGFYAGVPVLTDDGHALGTLCVIDHVPRELSDGQRGALRELGNCVEHLIRHRNQVRETANRLTRVYTETPGLLYLLDSTGAIIEVSDRWLNHFGYQRAEVLGRNAREFMTTSARKAFLKVREQLWAEGGCDDYPCQFKTAGGEPVDVLMSAAIEVCSQELPMRVKCVLTDVTSQIQLRRELEAQARTDQLTGVLNRRGFRESFSNEFSRIGRYAHPLSLIVLDVDYFKKLNDNYGHAAGDRALIVLSNQVRLALRNADVFGRIGGEEFALLLPETPLGGAVRVARRLRSQIESLDINAHGLARSITVSVGVTPVDTDGSIDEAFARADSAMYAAKEHGRNRVVVWEPQESTL